MVIPHAPILRISLLSGILLVGLFVTAVQAAPAITNPPPGSTLSGSTVTFDWTAGGSDVTKWWLYIGTSGVNSKDIYDSGSLGTATTDTVNGLPTDGSTVYVRLWHREAGSWKRTDFTYTAFTSGGGGGGSSGGLAIFDKNGTRVGPVFSTALVALNVDGFIFRLNFKKSSVAGDKQELYFELANCQGPPLWRIEPHEPEEIFSPRVILADQNANQPGFVVYTLDSDEFVGNIGWESLYTQGQGCENFLGSGPIPLFKAKQVIDLGASFQSPFHVAEDVAQ